MFWVEVIVETIEIYSENLLLQARAKAIAHYERQMSAGKSNVDVRDYISFMDSQVRILNLKIGILCESLLQEPAKCETAYIAILLLRFTRSLRSYSIYSSAETFTMHADECVSKNRSGKLI